jgi:chromosome segregation ATPase
MLRKIGIAAVLAVAGLWMLSSVTLGMKRTNSLAGSVFSSWRCKINRSVPLEVEIDRVRSEIGNLGPDMDKHIGAIAVEKARVERMKEEIATAKVNLRTQKDSILAMTKALETDATQVVYRGETLRASKLKSKLDREFTSYRNCEADVKSRDQLLEAREESLNVALSQLATMQQQKRDLEVAVARLETELKNVRLEQSRSKFQLDDSRLAHIKNSLNEIKERLRSERIETDLRNQYGETPANAETKARLASEITKEVRDYFKEGAPDNVVENK